MALTTPLCPSPKTRRRSGQAITEYAVLTAIIAIGLIVTTSLFGKVALGVLAQLGAAMKNDAVEPDKSTVKEAIASIEEDSAIQRNMRNFDQEDAGTPPAGGPSGQPAPSPSPSQAYSGTHHLGDSAAQNGGIINEGLTYEVTFIVTQDMINYANYVDGGALFLSFSAGGHAGDYNNFINNESANAILLDGQTAGHAANGQNSVALNIGNLSPGQHTVTFTSGELNTTRDDFNVEGIKIGHAGQ